MWFRKFGDWGATSLFAIFVCIRVQIAMIWSLVQIYRCVKPERVLRVVFRTLLSCNVTD